MIIRDSMETDVITVSKTTTYGELAHLLYKHGISGVPVVEDGRVVGVISEKDLFRVLFPYYKSFYENPESYTDLEERENKVQEIKDKPIEKYMTTKVITVSPLDPVMRAGALMLAYNINRLPVVEAGKLVGIITRKKIFQSLIKTSFHLE